MDFRMLGPFEAIDETGPVQLTAGKQRALLALLLLDAGRVVPIDRLVDDLWGDDVPETAAKMVQILVSSCASCCRLGCCARGPRAIWSSLRGTRSTSTGSSSSTSAGGRRWPTAGPARPRRRCAKRWSCGEGRRLRSSRSRSRGWRRAGWRSSTSPARRSGSRPS